MEVHVIEVLVYQAPSLVEHLLKLIFKILDNGLLEGNLCSPATCRIHFIQCSPLESVKFRIRVEECTVAEFLDWFGLCISLPLPTNENSPPRLADNGNKNLKVEPDSSQSRVVSPRLNAFRQFAVADTLHKICIQAFLPYGEVFFYGVFQKIHNHTSL